MKKGVLVVLLVPLLSGQQCFFSPMLPSSQETTPQGPTSSPSPAMRNPHVAIETDRGTVKVELFLTQAPAAVVNFLRYVKEGFYAGTIVHAVATAEGVYAGRYTSDLKPKGGVHRPIRNESTNGLSNARRYLAMVDGRGDVPATAAFVLYTANRPGYDYDPQSTGGAGRTVFGRVIEGMGVVDDIASSDVWPASDSNNQSLAYLPRRTIRIINVAVVDAEGEAPALTCPPGIKILQSGELTPVSIGTATATDPEEGVLTAMSDALEGGYPLGKTVVTWAATDRCGNVVTCEQDIEVRLGPQIQCPPDKAVEATGDLTPADLGTPTATDREDGTLTPTNDAPADGFPRGETIVHWTVTDSDGNTATCTQTVRVSRRPEITCPADVTLTATGERTPVDIGTATATDVEDGTLTPTHDAPANGFPVGDTVVTWTATDSSGLSAVCTQTIHVRGTPQLQCPADVVVEATGDFTSVDLGVVTATDHEDGSLTPANDAPAGGFPRGETIVHWTVTDSDGNTATCTQTVRVSSRPQIVCPADKLVEATDVFTPVDLGTATATDVEDGTLTPTNDAPADGFPLGETQVTWRAVDSFGLAATCVQKVVVVNPRVRLNVRGTGANAGIAGAVVIELFPALAPVTVANYLQYVDEHHYDGLIFHRVIDGFMVQTGGMLPDGSLRPTRPPIVNEAERSGSNLRGTVAMARTMVSDSATSQFFINLVDNDSLNYGSPQNPDGYAVFGRTVEGMESIVDMIALVDTDNDDRPLSDIFLDSVERIAPAAPVITTASGLQYIDYAIGYGPKPDPAGNVAIDYTGRLMDGTVFDSGERVRFSLSGVIAGFSEGIGSMYGGGVRRLIIPPDLGYGADPPPDSPIPPNATLIFDVVLQGL